MRPTGTVDPASKACAMCSHQPPCPSADRADRAAAQVMVAHPEQGWSLLCNGVILFDDAGQLLPDGEVVSPGTGTAGAGSRRRLPAAA
jgi:uncharacterized protein DUF5999